MLKKRLCLLLCLALLSCPASALAGNLTDNIKSAAESAKESTGNALNNLGNKLDDSSITGAVKGKILVTKGLDSLDISVQTKNGVVYLTGMVDEKAQIRLAGQVASEVEGVQKVINNLRTFK